MQVSGKIKRIGNHIQVTDSFSKRELVIETNEQYPQVLSIEFTQDRADLLNGKHIGQDVTVGINLRGREYIKEGEPKVFNSINGWKIDIIGASAEPAQAPEPQEEYETAF